LKGNQPVDIQSRRQTLNVKKHHLDFILAFEREMHNYFMKHPEDSNAEGMFTGTVAIDIMMSMGKIRDRETGVIQGEQLLQHGLIVSVDQDCNFQDNWSLFKIPEPPKPTVILNAGDMIFYNETKDVKIDYAIVRLMKKHISLSDRSYLYRRFDNCFIGEEAITKMVNARIARTRMEATILGNRVMNAGYIRHVTDHHIFKDGHFFYEFIDPHNYQGTSFRDSVSYMFCHRALLVLMLAGGFRYGAGLVWAQYSTLYYENEKHQSKDQVASYLSWVPLVGGIIGCIIGGYSSDFVSKRFKFQVWPRLLVVVGSCIAATPFAVGSMLLPAPWCYFSLVIKYCCAEMWMGALLAVVVNTVAGHLRAIAMCILFFTMANIGGSLPVVNGLLEIALPDLTTRLLILFPGLYTFSGILFTYGMYQLKSKEEHDAEATGSSFSLNSGSLSVH